MNIADYKTFDVINGTGIRNSLFVSGCSHHSCEGCFNSIAWNFNFGTSYDQDFENRILDDLQKGQGKITGFSILGGEPLDNLEGLLPLVKKIKTSFPLIDLWCWTGYYFENLNNIEEQEFLKYIDVLIDSPFQLQKRDLSLYWRGSSNQRIILVQESLQQNKIILHPDNYK